MSISEIQVGSLIRVKIGRNLIYAKVLEVLNDGFRVCSVAKNKEFHVTPSRIAFDEGEAEQSAPANAEPQNETEQEAAEPEANEQEPAGRRTRQDRLVRPRQRPRTPKLTNNTHIKHINHTNAGA